MQDQNYKCSVHKDTDAIRCCGECNAFYCNKCEKHHSEIHKDHQIFQIDKDADELPDEDFVIEADTEITYSQVDTRNKYRIESEENNLEINEEYFNDRRKNRKRKKKDKTNNDSDSDEDIFDFFKQKKNFSLIGDLNQEKMSK